MKDFDLGSLESEASGIDAFFASTPQAASPTPMVVTASVNPGRVKVGSLQQLAGFQRTSADTLVHLSTQALWGLRKEGNEFFIERLFNEGETQKG